MGEWGGSEVPVEVIFPRGAVARQNSPGGAKREDVSSFSAPGGTVACHRAPQGGGLQLGPPGDYRGLKVAYEFAPLLGAVGPPGTAEAGKSLYVPPFSRPGRPGQSHRPPIGDQFDRTDWGPL